jgi:predicted permease
MSVDSGSGDLLNHPALKNPTTCSTSSATRAVLSVKLQHTDRPVSCQQAREILLNVAKSPIIIACVLGLVVALVPFLRALFFSAEGSRAPLGFFFRMLEGIGRGYLPGVWLVVGAELRQGLLVQVQAMQAEGKQSFWEMVDKPIITVVLARLILVPLLNFATIFLLRYFHVVSSDPMFVFVALSTPIGPTSSTFQLIMEVLHAPHARYVSFSILVQFMCALLILPFTTFGVFLVMDASSHCVC